MRISHSPITWFAAFLLVVGALATISVFLKLDYGVRIRVAPKELPAVLDGPAVLMIMNGQDVRFQEFSTMAKCAEASIQVLAGTNGRVIVECQNK